jgi:crotonobetainyl-CoA:carnitine CoA-transferase CaiB-like acyl-CoA transferase
MNTLGDLLVDPQLSAVGFFRERVHPTEGRYIDMRPPAKFSARPHPETGYPPLIGEHSDEVAAELGFPADKKD